MSKYNFILPVEIFNSFTARKYTIYIPLYTSSKALNMEEQGEIAQSILSTIIHVDIIKATSPRLLIHLNKDTEHSLRKKHSLSAKFPLGKVGFSVDIASNLGESKSMLCAAGELRALTLKPLVCVDYTDEFPDYKLS